jgi:hypothetical protein
MLFVLFVLLTQVARQAAQRTRSSYCECPEITMSDRTVMVAAMLTAILAYSGEARERFTAATLSDKL